jgi:hypothetical protein
MYYYPKRFKQAYWSIPLHCHHWCNKFLCAYTIDTSNLDIQVNLNPSYKDGKCELYNKVIKTGIHLESYSFDNPFTLTGPLYKYDEIVIPTSSFDLYIDTPLTNPQTIPVSSSHHGFTLNELIYIIQQCYIELYNQEESTASVSEFNLTRECPCVNWDLKDSLVEFDATTTADCSICYSPFEEKVCRMKCGHEFHLNCIKSWVEKGQGKNCPLCRNAIKYCEECENKEEIQYTWSGVVIPEDIREDTYRNTTDGRYGIYTYDLKHLILTDIYYNRNLNKVVICVTPNVP